MKIDPNAALYTGSVQKTVAAAAGDEAQETGKNNPQNTTKQENIAYVAQEPLAQETAKTLFYAQTIASEASQDEIDEAEAIVQDFLEYMAKSTEEKWRERILSSMGLTEEELAAMTPEERDKVEDKIAKIIEDQIEEDIRENKKDGFAQEVKEAVENNSLRDVEMTKLSGNTLNRLDEKVMQMIDLPPEVENMYERAMEQQESEEKI